MSCRPPDLTSQSLPAAPLDAAPSLRSSSRGVGEAPSTIHTPPPLEEDKNTSCIFVTVLSTLWSWAFWPFSCLFSCLCPTPVPPQSKPPSLLASKGNKTEEGASIAVNQFTVNFAVGPVVQAGTDVIVVPFYMDLQAKTHILEIFAEAQRATCSEVINQLESFLQGHFSERFITSSGAQPSSQKYLFTLCPHSLPESQNCLQSVLRGFCSSPEGLEREEQKKSVETTCLEALRLASHVPSEPEIRSIAIPALLINPIEVLSPAEAQDIIFKTCHKFLEENPETRLKEIRIVFPTEWAYNHFMYSQEASSLVKQGDLGS